MYKVVILFLFLVFFLFYVGMEDVYGGYIFMFGVISELRLFDDKVVFFMFVFWGSFVLVWLVFVFLVRYLRFLKMICFDMIGCFIGLVVLVL